jgi:putative transcriptional regulator
VPVTVKLDDLLHDRRMTLTELADRVGVTLANFSQDRQGGRDPLLHARSDLRRARVAARRPSRVRAEHGEHEERDRAGKRSASRDRALSMRPKTPNRLKSCARSVVLGHAGP